jgi:hypothetical protein
MKKSPKLTTGQHAVNAAMNAGFEVAVHGVDRRRDQYMHLMRHADGRELAIYSTLGTCRLVKANGQYRELWHTPMLCVNSVAALRRLLSGE